MSFSAWRALVIDEVNEYDLFHGRLDGSTEDKVVPVRTIQFPVEDPSKVAVVSWRWDGKERMVGSRNVFCAIHQARKQGIEYLFIDVVSIDQRLSGDELIVHVVEFSKLYKSVQVIAAYDEVGAGIHQTLQRPWIFSEIQIYKHNQARVVAVKHLRSSQPFGIMGTLLRESWFQSLCSSVLGVLFGHHTMSSISDFKYIAHAQAHLFQAAYEKLSREDYLFTVALCCQFGRDGRLAAWTGEKALTALEIFDRYAFQDTEIKGTTTALTAYQCNQMVLLDGIHIANLSYRRYSIRGSDQFLISQLEPLDVAQVLIPEILGQTSFYDKYVNEYSDPISLQPWKEPRVEEFHLDLESLGLTDKD